jgi:hypothetical protein
MCRVTMTESMEAKRDNQLHNLVEITVNCRKADDNNGKAVIKSLMLYA